MQWAYDGETGADKQLQCPGAENCMSVYGGISVSDSTAPNRFVLEHFPRFSRICDLYSDL